MNTGSTLSRIAVVAMGLAAIVYGSPAASSPSLEDEREPSAEVPASDLRARATSIDTELRTETVEIPNGERRSVAGTATVYRLTQTDDQSDSIASHYRSGCAITHWQSNSIYWSTGPGGPYVNHSAYTEVSAGCPNSVSHLHKMSVYRDWVWGMERIDTGSTYANPGERDYSYLQAQCWSNPDQREYRASFEFSVTRITDCGQ